MTTLNLNDFQRYTQLAIDVAWSKEQELLSDLEDKHGEDLDRDFYMPEVQDQVTEHLKEYFQTEIKEYLEEDSCYSEEQIKVIESFFK